MNIYATIKRKSREKFRDQEYWKFSRKVRNFRDPTLYTFARGSTCRTSTAEKKGCLEFLGVLHPLPGRARKRNNLLSRNCLSSLLRSHVATIFYCMRGGVGWGFFACVISIIVARCYDRSSRFAPVRFASASEFVKSAGDDKSAESASSRR